MSEKILILEGCRQEEEYKEIHERIRNITRLHQTMGMNQTEFFYLYKCVKNIPPYGTYLEIGSTGNWGSSLLCTYEASKRAGNLINIIAIDWYFNKNKKIQDIHPWYRTRFRQFRQNISDIPRLKLIEKTSFKAAKTIKDNSIDVLLSGAGYLNFDNVRKDIKIYWPKVREGGMFLGRGLARRCKDSYRDFPKTKKVINNLFKGSEEMLEKSTMLIVRKRKSEWR